MGAGNLPMPTGCLYDGMGLFAVSLKENIDNIHYSLKVILFERIMGKAVFWLFTQLNYLERQGRGPEDNQRPTHYYDFLFFYMPFPFILKHYKNI